MFASLITDVRPVHAKRGFHCFIPMIQMVTACLISLQAVTKFIAKINLISTSSVSPNVLNLFSKSKSFLLSGETINLAKQFSMAVFLLHLIFLTTFLQGLAAQETCDACGLNNVCILNNRRPTCACQKGFSLLHSNDPNGDCLPDFSPSCDEVYIKDQFDFNEVSDIDWPGGDYATMVPSNKEECKTSCLKDCFCAVAIYRSHQCWKKKLPLSDGKQDFTLNVTAYLKYRKGDGPPGKPRPCPPEKPPHFLVEKKDRHSLITAGSALLGTSVFVNIVLSVLICFGIFLTHKKKIRKVDLGSTSVETNVIRFKYNELVQATNRFKEELGKGAFGIVYKGVIGTYTVAVKKLDRIVQDSDREFRTEVNVIARTHHKNLVQLLGFCDDGEQRLLVYEYMSNGTLASFLFGSMRPSWSHRCNIAFGIAKGLSYLHEECNTQIIHCDIKPHNILLDEYYNARISDFGLAKLLLMNQSRTNTGIRGTKGYVAPEWFRNTPVTAKVDVYSFGVLLLEIISCRKSVEGNESGDEDGAILTDWAWDCYQEKRLGVLVENDSEALVDVKKLKTFVMVGLWCIQENPSLRPTMRMVIRMLEGVVEVDEPPCPFPFSIS
ncbi:bulb-type lectin domain-containing protein [Artemisia annua]|uniref:non-specific serine/threonine protein kinase n=1 Tax=Artemisia annua TaxID=35608 RepID=A0A2U1KSP7_ARTAN|nr:bulb-type lectin domain-containing protein [Artemisia annua]